jgi:hypothetical protein
MKEAAQIADRVEIFILSKFAAIGVSPLRANPP